MDTTTATSTTPVLLDQFTKTAKQGRNCKRKIREGNILLGYAIEVGGRVALTPEAKSELTVRGLREDRIPNAVYDLKKYYGKQIKTERAGRNVAAYVISL